MRFITGCPLLDGEKSFFSHSKKLIKIYEISHNIYIKLTFLNVFAFSCDLRANQKTFFSIMRTKTLDPEADVLLGLYDYSYFLKHNKTK